MATTGHSPIAECLPRWQRPDITDRAAFYRAHPECRVSAELVDELRPMIMYRARQLDPGASPERMEEIAQEIIAGIIESATHFRRLDDAGRPIFDYLAQRRTYIVQHAAGRVSSEIRRERVTSNNLRPMSMTIHEPGPEHGTEISIADDRADADLTLPAEYSELVRAIGGRLTHPIQVRVLTLMAAGYSRAEIGDELGLARQRVHEHVVAIRNATNAVVHATEEPISLTAARVKRANRAKRAEVASRARGALRVLAGGKA